MKSSGQTKTLMRIQSKKESEINRDCERRGEKNVRMGPLRHLSTTLWIR